MSEFRIEKIRQAVTVTLATGKQLTGEIFLQPTARYRSGPQHPAELFNEPEPFIPVSVADELLLVAKDQVMTVQFADDSADTDSEGVEEEEASVDVVFSDGSETGGQLRLETRVERPRLLDFLNDDHQRFLTLRSPQGVILINRRRIAQVRQRR